MITHAPARPMLVVVLEILIVDILLVLAALVPVVVVGRTAKDVCTGGQLEQHHLHGAGHEQKREYRKADGRAEQFLHLAHHNGRNQHAAGSLNLTVSVSGRFVVVVAVSYASICQFVLCAFSRIIVVYLMDCFLISYCKFLALCLLLLWGMAAKLLYYSFWLQV